MLRIDDEKEFKKQSLGTTGLLLLNFWADWSIQCRNMSDVMRNIKALLDDTDTIAYIDWHHQKGLAKKLEVFGVPTLIIYFCGQEVARLSGTMSEVVLLRHIGNAKNNADNDPKLSTRRNSNGNQIQH
jgi:thioredoxin 1